MYGKSLAQAVSALFIRLKQYMKRMAPAPKPKTKDSELPKEEKAQLSVPAEVPTVENYAVQSIDPIEPSDKTVSSAQASDLSLKEEKAEEEPANTESSAPGFDILDVKEATPEAEPDPVKATGNDAETTEQTDPVDTEENNSSPEALQEKTESQSEDTDSEPVSGKNARRLRAVKTIAQRQRELYAKTHPDAR